MKRQCDGGRGKDCMRLFILQSDIGQGQLQKELRKMNALWHGDGSQPRAQDF
jgi:hypothetical protein